MLKMNFKGTKIFVIGIQGSGKTEWVKSKVRENFKRSIIWTQHASDWENEKGYFYVPTTNDILNELNEFCEGIIRVNKSKLTKHFDCVVFDDFDAVLNNASLPQVLRDLNANHRHYDDLSIFFICRRQQQLNTNIVESCHYLVCFAVEGENIYSKLKSISKELEIKVKGLQYKDYRCVIKPIGEQPYYELPIRIKKWI